MEETKFKNVDQSIKNNCNLILAKSQKEIYDISNFIAPEHLHTVSYTHLRAHET